MAANTLPADAPTRPNAQLWLWTQRLQMLLVVLTVGLRPLVAAHGAGTIDWLSIPIAAGLLLTVWQAARGWRRLRWDLPATGLMTAVLLILVWAAWRSPEPATGTALVMRVAAAACLGLWLSQIRELHHLVWSMLLVAAVGTVAFSLGQAVWVLPGLDAQITSGGDASTTTMLQQFGGDYVDRVRRGGVFGPFVQANHLAAWCLMLLPLLLGVLAQAARQHERRDHRILGALLLALALLAVLLLTGSKGAWLVLPLALLWTLLALRRWRPALIGGAALGLGLLLVLLVPGLRAGLMASIEVRLGYWAAGWQLISQEPLVGQGLAAFAVESPAVLAPAAEYSRSAHNVLIEAAVSGGVLLALLVAALLAWFLRPATATPSLASEAAPARDEPAPLWPGLALLLILPYLCLLELAGGGGVLADNLLRWPGGNPAGALFFALLIASLMAVAHWWLHGLPRPGPGWWLLALTALALLLLLDYAAQDATVLATLATLLALRPRGSAPEPAPPGPARSLGLGGAAATAVALLCASLVLLPRSRAIDEARDLAFTLGSVYAARDAEAQEAALGDLAFLIGQEAPTSRAAVDLLLSEACERIWLIGGARPAAPQIQIDAVRLQPRGETARNWALALTERFPAHAASWAALARSLQRRQDWPAAAEAAAQAAQRAPYDLSHRLLRARALGEAILAAEPEPTPELGAALAEEVAFIERWHGTVHFRKDVPEHWRRLLPVLPR